MLSLGSGNTYNLTVGRFGIAGNYANDPKTQEMIRTGYSAMRPGVLDPIARVKDQELDGIDAEVLLPSVLLGLNTLPNPKVIDATYHNYNDWVFNYASQSPKRLYPTACIPLHDVDLAIEELRRAKNMGHVGANIPCVPPLDKPYSDHYYDRFWAEAQELGTPLVMHFLTSALPNHGLPSTENGTGYGLAAYAIQRVIVSIIASGVCARYPKLQFVPTEWETGWVAHFLKRMDWSTYVNKSAMAQECDMSFSDYFHQNFSVTFEDDLVGIQTRHGIRRREYDVGLRFPPPRLDLPALPGRPRRHLRRRPRRRARPHYLGQLHSPLQPALRKLTFTPTELTSKAGHFARPSLFLASTQTLHGGAPPNVLVGGAAPLWPFILRLSKDERPSSDALPFERHSDSVIHRRQQDEIYDSPDSAGRLSALTTSGVEDPRRATHARRAEHRRIPQQPPNRRPRDQPQVRPAAADAHRLPVRRRDDGDQPRGFSQKAKNLMRRPDASLAVIDGQRQLIVTGSMHVVTDEAEVLRLNKERMRKIASASSQTTS